MTLAIGQTTRLEPNDLDIIGMLQSDGRMPYAVMAKELGVGVHAVTERVNRLVADKVISVTAVTNPLHLSGYCQALIGLRTTGDMRSIVRTLRSIPQVTYVVSTLGDCDIIAEVVTHSNQGIRGFVNDHLRVIPGITRIHVFSCSQLMLDNHNVAVIDMLERRRSAEKFNFGGGNTVVDVDERMIQILNILHRNGRETYSNIGEMIGISHTAVRRRMEMLRREGIARVMATVNPLRISGLRQAFIGLSVVLPHNPPLDELLAIDEVTYVVEGVGFRTSEFMVEAVASDDTALFGVVQKKIRALPGVEQTWWATAVSVEKESYWLDTAADALPGAKGLVQ